jgi:hypothetical protein
VDPQEIHTAAIQSGTEILAEILPQPAGGVKPYFVEHPGEVVHPEGFLIG